MAPEQTNIRGTDYRLFKLAPMQGGRLATEVAQILAAGLDGGSIDALVKAYKDRKPDAAPAEGEASPTGFLDALGDDAKLLGALAGGVARVDANRLYDLALQCLAPGLFADSKKLHDTTAQNAWFGEHPDHLLLCLAWALKVNCAGFFGKGGQA